MVDAGALYGTADNELRAAFNYELIKRNRHSKSKFLLSSDSDHIDNDDSYAVGAASKTDSRNNSLSTLSDSNIILGADSNNRNKSAQSNLGTGPRLGRCARRWLA